MISWIESCVRTVYYTCLMLGRVTGANMALDCIGESWLDMCVRIPPLAFER